MNSGPTCTGVFREPAHSPGRVDDDAAIMERVAAAMRERGFRVELTSADAVMEGPPANLFVMCERGTVLDRLAAMVLAAHAAQSHQSHSNGQAADTQQGPRVSPWKTRGRLGNLR